MPHLRPTIPSTIERDRAYDILVSARNVWESAPPSRCTLTEPNQSGWWIGISDNGAAKANEKEEKKPLRTRGHVMWQASALGILSDYCWQSTLVAADHRFSDAFHIFRRYTVFFFFLFWIWRRSNDAPNDRDRTRLLASPYRLASSRESTNWDRKRWEKEIRSRASLSHFSSTHDSPWLLLSLLTLYTL